MNSSPKQASGLLDYIVAAIPFLIILLGYSSQVLDPALSTKFTLLGAYLVLLGGILFFQKRQIPLSIFKEKIFLWYGPYLVLSLFSITHTFNIPDGIFDGGKLVLMFALFLAWSLYFSGRPGYTELHCRIISLFAFGAVFFGIWQFVGVLGTEQLTHLSTYGVSATFAHRNLYAEVLFMTLPFVINTAGKDSGWWKKIAFVTLALVLFLLIILLVRAVWLALVAGFFVTVITYLLSGRKSIHGSTVLQILRKNWIYAGIIIAAIAVAGFIYSSRGSLEVFRKQGSSILDVSYGSGKDRKDLWIRSFKLIKQQPFQGWGLGSWKIQMLRFSVKGTQMEDGVTFYQSPHNDFIWIWSEAGVFTLISYLLLFATAFYYLFRILKRPGQERGIYCLYAGGLAGYMVFASLSFPKERIEESLLLNIVLSSILVAFHSGKAANSTEKKKVPLKLIAIGLIVISVGLIYIGCQRINGEHAMLKAFEAKERQDWQSAINNCRKAESRFYVLDPVSTPVRWHSGMSYFNLGLKDKALEDFLVAYKVNPCHVHVLNNIGTCMEERGEHEKAVDFFRKALAINPSFEDALLNLAAIYFNAGLVDSAAAQLARVPYQSTNPRITEYIAAIVPAKIDQMLGHWPAAYDNYFRKVASSPERCLQTFKLARNYPRSLRDELEAEARDSLNKNF